MTNVLGPPKPTYTDLRVIDRHQLRELNDALRQHLVADRRALLHRDMHQKFSKSERC